MEHCQWLQSALERFDMALSPAARLPGRRQVCDLLSITVAVALRVWKLSLEGPMMLPTRSCASRSVATAVAARTTALGGRFRVARPLHRAMSLC